MGWFDRFKSKNPKVTCLICEKSVRESDSTSVKYRYGEGEGIIGTAHLCGKCSRYVNKKDDEDYGESI